MVILVSLKYPCQKRIKRKPLLLALSVPLLIDACLLVYVMHLLPFKDVYMTAIFSDFCEKIVEVFMDDFSVYRTSFDDCLCNLDRVLQKYKKPSICF